MRDFEIVHLGLPKTGSTSLQKIWESDDRIELHLKRRELQTYKWYSRKENTNHVFGKSLRIHSDETFLRTVNNNVKNEILFERINKSIKNPKILLVIREPKSLLISRYRYGVLKGNISVGFEKWLQSEDGTDFIGLCNFSNLYKSLTHHFDRSKIKILCFEDLKADYLTFYNDVYEYLELSSPENLTNLHENTKSLSSSELKQKMYLNKILPRYPHFNRTRNYNYLNKVLLKIVKMKKSSNFNLHIDWEDSIFLKEVCEELRFSNRSFEENSGIEINQKGYDI